MMNSRNLVCLMIHLQSDFNLILSFT